MSLSGSSQYITYAVNSNIPVASSQPFTIEFWIYSPTQVQTAPAVFSTTANGGLTDHMAFFVGHSGLGITNQYGLYWVGMPAGTGGAGTTTNLLSSTINRILNAWTHIAIVRVGTNAVTMYINGVSNATATYTGSVSFSTTSTLWVGTSGDNLAASSYTGYISNLRWATGLAIYTGNFTVPTRPLATSQNSGTNISNVSATQTTMLLNTPNSTAFIADSSTNNYTPTNVGSAVAIAQSPFTQTAAGGWQLG